MSALRLGTDFTMDANLATRRAVLLGQPDSGKTNGLTVIAEELLKIGVPITVLDWKGDLWGLRSSANGKKEGFSIVIFGGDHADVEITDRDGREIGNIVAAEKMPSLIDLSAFVSDGARRRFATAFLKAFFAAKHRVPTPHTLLIDEYQKFAPQVTRGGNKGEGDDEGAPVMLLGATETVVGLGRKRGIGVIGTAQRAAQLNKNVVELSDVYLFMQVAGKNDLASIRETVQQVATKDELETLSGGIPRLGKGEVFVYSPAWLRILEKHRFRLRETFDSSRTPEVGVEAALEPTAFALIDVPSLRSRIESTREKREAEDPDALRKRITELERQLKEQPTEPVAVEKIVEVPAINREDLDRVVTTMQSMGAFADEIRRIVDRLGAGLESVSAANDAQVPTHMLTAIGWSPQKGPSPGAPEAQRAARPAARAMPQASDIGQNIGSGAQRLLDAIAMRHPKPISRKQIGVLSGFSSKSGTFDTYMSRLRSGGFIESAGGGLTKLTSAGRAQTHARAPQSKEETIAMWLGKLGGGEARLFRVLIDVYPRGITRAELGERAGYSSTSGTFDTYVSRLRSTGLATGERGTIRAAEELFA